MCEKGPKRRSCTECPQYDGLMCLAADKVLGTEKQVLQREHQRGFICIDTEEGGMTESVDYPKDNPNTDWPQYNGLECRATDAWQSGRENTTIVADSADLKEVTVSPPMPEHEISIVFSLDEGARTQISNSPGPVELTFQYEEKEPGSPSSECPSRREGPPQKGKIDENNPSDAPLIPSGTIVAGEGIQVIENPGPMWKDTNGYWEPVRPRSCTNCKLYNDPICMKMVTHIGTCQEILAKEEAQGFHCFAADQMQREE